MSNAFYGYSIAHGIKSTKLVTETRKWLTIVGGHVGPVPRIEFLEYFCVVCADRANIYLASRWLSKWKVVCFDLAAIQSIAVDLAISKLSPESTNWW